MYDLSIEYQIDEFMIYCRSRELRAKTLESYEHTLRLFERWCNDELNITQVDQVCSHFAPLCTYITVTEQAYLDLTDEDIGKRYQQFSPVVNMR